jgi:hypothetical protein
MTRQFTGSGLLSARIAYCGVLGLLTCGAGAIFVNTPSWQAAVTVLCLGMCAALMWVALGWWTKPFAPGVPRRDRVRGVVASAGVVILFGLGAWTFSLAPYSG